MIGPLFSPAAVAGKPAIAATSAVASAVRTSETGRASAIDAPSADAGAVDVRSMTPYEIDAWAETLPAEPAEFKMMVLTRGAEFQRHLAETVAAATGVPVDKAALEARLASKMDLIESFETARDFAQRAGDPTDVFDRTLNALYRIEARRLLPEGGVAL